MSTTHRTHQARLIASLLLALGLAILAAGGLGMGGADSAASGHPFGLESVATGFERPIAIEQPPGEDRLFVAEQAGRIYICLLYTSPSPRD